MDARLIAFRGLGSGDVQKYLSQGIHPLLIAGHVGVQLDGQDIIFGFSPTEAAITQVGGILAFFDLAKGGHNPPFAASVKDDTHVFEQAYVLHRTIPIPANRPNVLEVIVLNKVVPDGVGELMLERLLDYLTFPDKHTLWYNFPQKPEGTFDANQSNCAIFPSTIGFPLPSLNGYIPTFINEMVKQGAELWHPPTK